MNATQQSIFNLIALFRSAKKTVVQPISAEQHCERMHHHDFYCDAEKPFVEKLNQNK
ncbi:MAG: hypothetical protein HRT65_10555 [Flavobacteriaceae bacterium]|uniref:hypothetical protein n=1 Tax=Flagellimonas algarum TaxID=3230298 RepID=UPI00339A30E8|nr:hypothetical protein [Flavobacteriaceae bacterium]